MLSINNLRLEFLTPDGTPLPIIDVPAFALQAGEQLSLIGSSGSGKTTFLHLLAGILRADSGTITYTLPNAPPVELNTLSESQRDQFRGQNLGYIFQTHHLLTGFTALENVMLGMSFTRRKPNKEWAMHLLERVGLSDRLHFKPAKLSVGQQQRVAVARALANRPALVLADEPTGSVDETHAWQVLDVIRSLCTETSAGLLLVSHDLAIANSFPRRLDLKEINLAHRAAPAFAKEAS